MICGRFCRVRIVRVRYRQCVVCVCVRCTECDLCGCGQSIPTTAAGLSSDTMTKTTQKSGKEMVGNVKRLAGGGWDR